MLFRVASSSVSDRFFQSCARLAVDAAPRAAQVAQAARGEGAVGVIRLPPDFGMRRQAGVRFAPAGDQAVSAIVRRQLQAGIVHGQQAGRGGFNLGAMLLNRRGVVGVVEIARDQ